MADEYIFFDEGLRDRFVQFVTGRSIACRSRADAMEGLLVELPDGLDDDVSDAVEAQYQALMDEQVVLAESRADWATRRVAAVPVTRPDGSRCVIRLPAEIARPLLEHFTAEQVQALAQAIANGLDNPSDEPLCRRQPL
jgi:hypothetical protein